MRLSKTAAVPLSLALAGLFWAGCQINGSGSLEPQAKSESHSNLVAHGPMPRHSLSYDRKLIFSQGGLDRFATFSYHEQGIDFYTSEEVPSGKYSWQKAVTTPYFLEAVACRTAEEVFIAGLDPLTNEVVIEKWSYTAPSGSLASAHGSYQGTLGQPQPLLSTSVQVVGGSFVPPKDRVIPQPTKQTVYRGNDFSGVKSMCVDPEGRFLLVQDSSSFEIYQLNPGQSPAKLLSSLDFPELNSSFFLSPAYQLGVIDRVFTVQGMPGFGGDVAVFHDSDNDGVLEPPLFLTMMEFMNAYPDSIRDPSNPWEYAN